MLFIKINRLFKSGIESFTILCLSLLPLGLMADAGVSGAGTPDTNGTYVEGVTFNGKPSYSNGTYFMFWNSTLGEWNIGTTLNNSANIYYYHGSDTPLPSATGWQQDLGASPVPTITPVLPVEWAYFHANLENRQIKLEWATYRETNLSHYELERKDESSGQWQNIYQHTVEQANTNTLTSYNFIDALPPAGYIQYRIKQVDLNGDFSFSKQLEVLVKAESLTLFPNPAQDRLFLRDLTINQDLIGVEILDLRGNRIRFFRKEELTQALFIAELARGHYCLQVLRRNSKKIERQIFQKW